jgi:CBS domain containing-hemolysin-like protein
LSLLVTYIAIAIGVSFTCSLLEAALLSSRNAILTAQAKAGNTGAEHLLKIRTERVDDAISAILTLNTVANTLGATLAGAQAARVFGSKWVGVFSGLLAFAILVFSEIIPKTLGAVYWRQISGGVGWALQILTKAMTPALFFSRALTRLLTRGRQVTFSRSELSATIEAATRHGVLSPGESRIFENLLRFDEVRVEDVMTPRTVSVMLPTEATFGGLLDNRKAESFSRIPLYRDHRDNVVGYVLQRQVLKAVTEGAPLTTPLEQLMRPIPFIPEVATLGAALRQFLERREPVAMAIDEHGGISGLVTLEDLTETILGVEIIDESDRIVDQRLAATRLRDQRMQRIIQRRKELGRQEDHIEN